MVNIDEFTLPPQTFNPSFPFFSHRLPLSAPLLLQPIWLYFGEKGKNKTTQNWFVKQVVHHALNPPKATKKGLGSGGSGYSNDTHYPLVKNGKIIL